MTRISDNIQQVMPPEIALLAACAHTHLTNAHKQEISRLLVAGLDWDTVISNAIYHKVIPLLHRTLTHHFKDETPEKVAAKINVHLKRSVLQTFAISAALIKVTRLLTENNIDVLPVKGALLSQKLYNSPTMRTYTDVDILVRQEDLIGALNLLQENGYKLLPEGIAQSTYLKFLKYYHHGRLLDKNGILIELHWELSGFYAPTPMTLNSIVPFLTKTEFNNYPTLDLTDEMLFIFLCLHGNKHNWAKLDYISSLAELIRITPNLDWPVILDLGKKLKMQKRILLALLLADKLFSTAIPEQIEDMRARHPGVDRLADTLIANEISRNTEDSTMHPIKKIIMYQPLIMDGKLDAARFIIRSLVVPEHEIWHTTRLPDALFPLYFLDKPYRALTMPIRKMLQP
ncbi:MAG: nucleotidyltransferase family protein [Desulfobulbaceae bacterium]|nr:nucleotidyltransferase family protein [Desulfobulbaceae bacterium]